MANIGNNVQWHLTKRLAHIGSAVNSSSLGQNGRHFADDIFKYIFMNQKFSISIRISLKFVLKGQIDKKSALVKVMDWRRTGDKPLPETLLTQFIDAYMHAALGDELTLMTLVFTWAYFCKYLREHYLTYQASVLYPQGDRWRRFWGRRQSTRMMTSLNKTRL